MNLYELDNSKSPRKKIAEISDKVMHDYRRRAHYDVQGHKFGSKKDDPNAAAIIAKREKGMAQAGSKITARRDAEMAKRREAENQRLRDKYAGVDIDAEMAKLKPAMDRAYHEYQYGARNTWSQGRDDYQSLSGKMAELQRAKSALGEGMSEEYHPNNPSYEIQSQGQQAAMAGKPNNNPYGDPDDSKEAYFWQEGYEIGLQLLQIRKQRQGVAEGSLNEFAPDSNDGGEDGFSDEMLKQLASQWYNGDEDPRVERTLMAAGWEIGQDEGYDDEPGVFVVQAGDINGNSYMSWPAHELKQGVTEGKYKCSCHPGDADPDCPVHGLEPMEVGDALDVKEGVADSLPMADAVKVLKQYGAEHFKTGSESLNFYKGGKPYKLELTWNDDTTRSVSLSELNHVVRTLKAQENKFNFNPDDNWSQDFETRMSKGVSEGTDDLRDSVLDVLKAIYNGSSSGEYMIDTLADEFGQYYDEVEASGDQSLQNAYSFMMDNGQEADGDPQAMAQIAKQAISMLTQGVAEDNDGFDTHIVMVTVSDPGHQAVTQRGELKQRRCRVRADDRESAINTAIKWYRKQGYKVHDHHYVGAIRSGATPRNEDTGLNELSNELLGRYKKELGVRASAADKAGDYDKGHEYFKKINKATIRQGENDARKHERENQDDVMETRLNMMRKAGYDL